MNGLPPVVFLDASVLYPALLRNILLHLALHDLYQPRWSARVQDEWLNALRRDRPELDSDRLHRTRELMDTQFSAAMVSDYEHWVDGITLPDADDRHVAAAALQGRAKTIVTANLRDFPAPVLTGYGLEAIHPDAFIAGLIDDSPDTALAAFRQLRQSLKQPLFTAIELATLMERQSLTATAALLHANAAAF